MDKVTFVYVLPVLCPQEDQQMQYLLWMTRSCHYKPPEKVWWSSDFMRVAWARRWLGAVSFLFPDKSIPSSRLFTCILSGTFKEECIILYFEQLALSVTVLVSKVLVLVNVAIMLTDFFSLFAPRYCCKSGVKWAFFGTCTCTKQS